MMRSNLFPFCCSHKNVTFLTGLNLLYYRSSFEGSQWQENKTTPSPVDMLNLQKVHFTALVAVLTEAILQKKK